MTAYNLLKRSLLRIGYDNYGEEYFSEKGLETVNQILSDLKLEGLTLLSDEIDLNDAQYDTACCGVAMMIALLEGDTEKNRIFASVYNLKRTALLSKKGKIEDIMPYTGGGE